MSTENEEMSLPEIDINEKLSHLNKHMQRLPWAANNIGQSPGDIKAFIVDWLVPLLSDVQHVVTGALGDVDALHEQMDEQASTVEEFMDSLEQQVGTGLLMARSTFSGEALALLHMHYKKLHGHLLGKLPPTDPASFALTEMHEVFVRIGYEPPVGTPGGDAPANEAEPAPAG